MRDLTLTQKIALSVAALLSVAQVVIVFTSRYLPLADYPLWLFEVDRVAALLHGDASARSVYHFVHSPVPNSGFVAIIFLLSRLLPLEVAGKCVLAVCALGLPWAWFFSVRRIKGPDSGLAYLGFPFAFNLFFWGRDAYLLALIVLIAGVAWLSGRLRDPQGRLSVGLGLFGVALYFLHGAVFAIWAAVVLALVGRSAHSLSVRFRWILAGTVPGIVLFLWYVLTDAPHTPGASFAWGLTVLARNIVKPLLLFVKTYGIGSSFPISAANATWVAVLTAAIGSAVWHVRLRDLMREPLVPAIVVCLAGALALPDIAFGIVSPGAYCVLPALFLFTVVLPEQRSAAWMPVTFILCAAVMTISAAAYTHKVDGMMSACVSDTRTYTRPDAPHAVVGYDWPAETGPGDAFSASVNPLYASYHYVLLENPGSAWIHETAFLRLHKDHAWLYPRFSGDTRQRLHADVVSRIESLDRFNTIMVAGMNAEAEELVDLLGTRGFRRVCARPLWTILADSSADDRSTP